jgi:hypothetical protein
MSFDARNDTNEMPGVVVNTASLMETNQLKQSTLRASMQDLVKNRFDLCLHHNVPDSESKHQQAWKGLKLMEAEVLAWRSCGK